MSAGIERVVVMGQSFAQLTGPYLDDGERFRLLLDLSKTYASQSDLREVLPSIASKLRSGVRCSRIVVSLPDEHKRRLYIHAADGGSPIESRKERDSFTGAAGRAFLSGRRVFSETESGAECHLPLLSGERSMGLLSLFWTECSPSEDQERDFLEAVARQMTVALERDLAQSDARALKDQLAQEKLFTEDEAGANTSFAEIVGQSAALKRVLRQVQMVAPTDSTVLVCGETGTGKELIARAIHQFSARSRAPFVKLNCAAIPTGLLESELFGHERGAFTGAIAQRIGRFEFAGRGTLFLDEIGEIPLELQPKLLRVLQEREFERLGNSRTLSSDARLVAATNRDLATIVAEGKFRSDLYYRLNVFPVTVPPLSERREDIPLLVRHFVRNLSGKMNKAIDTIPAEAMKALTDYHWPGNIRELQNVLERAVILSSGTVLKLSASDFPEARAEEEPDGQLDTLIDAERKHILRALALSKGVVAGMGGAAALLGVKRSTLQAKMQRLGIQRSS